MAAGRLILSAKIIFFANFEKILKFEVSREHLNS
jgi:hypothetical protein